MRLMYIVIMSDIFTQSVGRDIVVGAINVAGTVNSLQLMKSTAPL